MTGVRYHLEIVPAPPSTDVWADHLRWCVAVMDYGDQDLGVAASMLHFCLEKHRLSEKQKAWAHQIIVRVRGQYDAYSLDLQRQIAAAGLASERVIGS